MFCNMQFTIFLTLLFFCLLKSQTLNFGRTWNLRQNEKHKFRTCMTNYVSSELLPAGNILSENFCCLIVALQISKSFDWRQVQFGVTVTDQVGTRPDFWARPYLSMFDATEPESIWSKLFIPLSKPEYIFDAVFSRIYM